MDWKEKIQSIHPAERLFFGEPMSRHTTFRIGGAADCYAVTDDAAEVEKLVSFAEREGIPYTVIGNGSNLLVSDAGIRGLVIRLEGSRFIKTGKDGERTLVTVSAGTLLSSFAKALCRGGYTGLEFATGIPGSVGGAVVMNAGAYGGEVKDALFSAELFENGRVVSVPASELDLSYRHSNVTKRGAIVLSATFGVKKAEDPDAVDSLVTELSAKRKEKQPLEYPSAGSTFKRPEGYFAGKLIDDCGLRGYRVGDAQVSEKHCGFVINRGNATASEVIKLIAAVQKTVFDRFGVKIEPEVRFLGFTKEELSEII